MRSLDFQLTYSFQPHYGLGVDSTSKARQNDNCSRRSLFGSSEDVKGRNRENAQQSSNSFVDELSFFIQFSQNSLIVIRHRGREDTRSPARDGASLSRSLIVSCHDYNCKEGGKKPNHLIQNPLLFVTETPLTWQYLLCSCQHNTTSSRWSLLSTMPCSGTWCRILQEKLTDVHSQYNICLI
jgi:hypothetical protein